MATEQDSQAAVGLAVSIGCSRTHADRLSAEHRHLVPAIIAAFAEIDKGFICFRVEEGETLGVAIRRFAAADHKFVDPTGREWRPDLSRIAAMDDTAAGNFAALRCLTGAFAQTIVIFVDEQSLDEEFFDLYEAERSDSRLVLVE